MDLKLNLCQLSVPFWPRLAALASTLFMYSILFLQLKVFLIYDCSFNKM